MSEEIKHSEERNRQYLVLDPELIQRNTAGDEISLFDLWAVLSKKRTIILGIFAASLVISAATAFLLTPVYQATIYFEPPLKKDIEALIIPEFSSGYTTDSVYTAFQNNFMARNNLWDFFIEKQLYEAYLGENDYDDADIAYTFDKEFLKDITLHLSKLGGEQAFMNATLDWDDATEGAALLNEYSQNVSNKTLEQYVDELGNKLLLEKERVHAKINLLRESAQREKEYLLAKLNENISIAKELGIKRRDDLLERKTSDVFVDASGKQPLYYQGYEALEAEKSALQSRKDNDPFVSGLNERLKELEYLNSIKIPADQITVVRVTQHAKALNQPIKPKKMLIIVLGGVLGLFFGIFAAFVAYAVGRGAVNDTLLGS